MEYFTQPVEGQNDGQETASTHGCLQLHLVARALRAIARPAQQLQIVDMVAHAAGACTTWSISQ